MSAKSKVFCGLGGLLICGAAIALSLLQEARPSRLVSVSHGAAGEVSGSLHLLDTGNGLWMIDCGAVIENEYEEDRESPEPPTALKSENAAEIEEPLPRLPPRAGRGFSIPQSLPPEAIKASAVFLTHAHTDHLGRLPLLVEQGYKGAIYATEITAALAVPMLRVLARCDHARVRCWKWSKSRFAEAIAEGKPLFLHWQGCPWCEKIVATDLEHTECSLEELLARFAAEQPKLKTVLCEKCMEAEIAAVCRLFRTVEYNTPIKVAEEVQVTFLDAGHIPGSASVLFEVELEGKTRRVLYSGDLGGGLSPLVRRPEPAPPCDVLFVETTYGTACRKPEVRSERAKFRRAVGEALSQNGVLWIPCFSLDRTQQVLYELRQAQREKLLPRQIPIYCPSPTAREVTSLYNAHLQDHWFPQDVARDSSAFSPGKIFVTVPTLARLPRPCIIISTSDFLLSPWMRRLLRELLPEPSTSIFLVCYYDPAGSGGKLKSGATTLEIDGVETPVRARVQSFQCFSGHADAADIDAWLTHVPKKATLILIHGDREELSERAAQLREEGWEKIIIAEPGKQIDLFPTRNKTQTNSFGDKNRSCSAGPELGRDHTVRCFASWALMSKSYLPSSTQRQYTAVIRAIKTHPRKTTKMVLVLRIFQST